MMSRWTWMECIIWVGAIAAISSVSHAQSNFFVEDQSQVRSVRTPLLLASSDCDQVDQEPFPFGLINIKQKSAAESLCYFFGPRNSQGMQKTQPPLSLTVRLIR
ncbi:MAG: hypothetical protein WAN66_13125 [Limnoraphis robusta]|nr:hypothetical protein [Limnoraphis robusta]MEA5498682.1 hypothetical protein [Limnoraphis robusta BA-68 BA1]MEA5538412.1 hypothetical protein [Limnoraphis robusta Tam1]